MWVMIGEAITPLLGKIEKAVAANPEYNPRSVFLAEASKKEQRLT